MLLSFTDSDLARRSPPPGRRGGGPLPSLRLANLAALKHPYSVDLYLEKVVRQARFVLVRLLGGMDYWRYGVDELAALRRRHGIQLAIVPGDDRDDARLDEASTLPVDDLRAALGAISQRAAPTTSRACLRFIAAVARRRRGVAGPSPRARSRAFGGVVRERATARARDDAPRRADRLLPLDLLAADTAPIDALATRSARAGLRGRPRCMSPA